MCYFVKRRITMGILIAIDGLDGSGKTTQTELLFKKLVSDGRKVRMLSFPDYQSDSSALVKMYLGGQLGETPDDVNAYAASTFYAVDRFASFKRNWKKDYDDGAIILCNRYTTANLFHQMEKLPRDRWDSFIEWLEDLEYEKLTLPRPNKVLYLDMRPDISKKLLSGRYQGDESRRDIHEKDFSYLERCRVAALYVAEKLDWKVIKCFENEKPRTLEEIEKEIYNEIKKISY